MTVPGEALEIRFTTSTGPGGQNVNRVQTRAVVRLHLDHVAPLIPADALQRLKQLAGPGRLTADGLLYIASERTRHQARNLADARARLADLIRQALPRPKPRKPTRPSRSAKRKRLQAKRRRSEVKRGRGRPSGDD